MPHIIIEKGDITKVAVHAIVNAANPRLLGGGGVDGAIHRAAGPQLLEACRAIPVLDDDDVSAATRYITAGDVRCPVGSTRVTPAFDLPAKFIIHTVGPVYDPTIPNECEVMLRAAYRSSLLRAEALGCRTVAFPAISCGVYGYPLSEAAVIALEVVREKDWDIDEVRFVLFLDDVLKVFQAADRLLTQ